MPISAAIGLISAVGTGIADVGAAIGGALVPAAAAADVGAGAVAADVGAGVAADVGAGAAAAGGATALPEILVTPAAEAAAAGGAATEAGLAGGALTGAEAAGAGLLGGAPIAGAAGAEAAGLGAGGAAAGGAVGATEALAGTTGPLAALAPTDVIGGDFAALDAAGIGPAADLTAGGLAAADVAGTPIGDTALAFAPSTTIDPLSGVAGGGGGISTDAFANAPVGTPGLVSSDLATALNTGQLGEGGSSGADTWASGLQVPGGPAAQLAGTGITPPESLPSTIDAGAATTGASATPGASDINAISASTGALPAGTSLTTPGGGVSGAASSLFSGSTLRTLGELAPLGALGLILSRGQPSLPPAEQQAINANAPAQALANQQLTEASTYTLQPGQAAQVQQYIQNSKNALYQFYARMGRDPNTDTDYLQGVEQINQNAAVMTQGFIDSAVTNGLKAQGIVDSTLQSAAQLQVQQDQAFQNSLTAAMQSFGLVTALNVAGSRGAAAAPTAA